MGGKFLKRVVFGLLVLTSGCSYHIDGESMVVDGHFTYGEIHFKQTFAWHGSYFLDASGAITNNSGIDIRYARFELAVLDAKGAVLETVTIFIQNFRHGTTRHFVRIMEVNSQEIDSYSIQYTSL